jgi:hypothetical protein
MRQVALAMRRIGKSRADASILLKVPRYRRRAKEEPGQTLREHPTLRNEACDERWGKGRVHRREEEERIHRELWIRGKEGTRRKAQKAIRFETESK